MPLESQENSLEHIREKLTNTVLVATIGFAGVALAGSLSRIPTIGFLPAMWVHIVSTCVLVAFYLFRHRFSNTIKAGLITSLFFIMGVVGIHTFGLSGNGIYLIFAAAIFSSLMLSMGAAVAIAISGGLVLFYYMELVWLNAFEFSVEQSVYGLSVSAWVTSLLTYAFIISITLFLIQHFLHYLQSLLLDKQITIDSQSSKIERSEAIFQTVINHLPYGISWKDKQLRYLGANQAFLEDSKIEHINQLKGKTDFDIADEKQAKKLVNLDRRIIYGNEKSIQYQEKEVSRGNKFKFKEVTHLALQSKKQDLIGVLTSYHDITESKNLELKAERAREIAEKASKTKSQFLANMSHEIRTPINGVLGLLDLCLHTDLNKQQTEYLSRANFSAKLLLQIVNDVLDLSKIEAGHFKLENHHFCFEDILLQVENLFSSQATSKNIKFNTQILGKQNVTLMGDPTRVMQILMNLSSNAVKFTHIGKVDVLVKIVTSDDQAKVKILVTDTGVGIETKSIPKLFNKFTQVDESITRKYGGTGLGLSIVKQLVEAMGSSIIVRSEIAKGTEFSFMLQLPLAKERRVNIARPNFKQNLANKRILLVEDNAINQEVAKSILEQSEAQVTVANNGQESLDILLEEDFDLVLMDVQMPVLDGCSALKILRQNEKWVDLPVIALTANVFAEEVAYYKEIGFTAHLGKPFSRQALLEIVQLYMQPSMLSEQV
ncbi:ATP-binding protein [Aliiglaciecola lipolytica]|uniref:ATP-binding protein n=1 Tax=Aliiglaciecola lipolytica TaxID=477689 RepID=UPI001C090B20|nr:ATP-binding protein [Aliiglaciecola lipolytica]MBU2876798.1 response regulator [Aliiglaciecola lipolytica]